MDFLRCVVERITYQNPENGYSVIKCRVSGESDLVTVVGSMPDVHVGSVLKMSGSWRMDARYGRQFSAEKWEETLPATVYGIEKYLGSGLIKGVGPKVAKKIVSAFGDRTLEVIEDDPQRLREVPGIGKARVDMIIREWQAQKEIKNIMLFLQSHDVSTAHAARIYRTYGNDSLKIVNENPYRLADDIWGIGFKTADQIAMKLGMDPGSFVRLRSGLLYALNQLANEGHCFALRNQLIETASSLLSAEPELLSFTLDQMIEKNDVITEILKGGERAIYLPPYYFSESGTAKRIRGILDGPKKSAADPADLISRVEAQDGKEYDEIQREAIRTAVSSKLMILTGGPGTGKTTTVKGIISAFRMSGRQVTLAAPTGRAAKRMSEATGMESKTIHRLLEVMPPSGYRRNEKNPLTGDVLIIDECSMIDLLLMYNLLKAVPDSMTLILVGDTDQLPSVGAGNVLSDLIASGAVPVVRLTHVFRQAQGSRIIMNAHRVKASELPDMRGGKDSDFFEVERPEPESAVATAVQFVTRNLPRYYHLDPFRDIQVLTPMQRGPEGAVLLNQKLQEAMNPGSPALRRGNVSYRLHDKVMQIRNDYDKEVFNGDIGFVSEVNADEKSLTVDFDGRQVLYDISELDELELAYAVTVHKSQGSEYPLVLLMFSMSHYVMLQKNLLYTAITRAKKVLVLVGEKKAVSVAVKRDGARKRNTLLAWRLSGDASQKAAAGDDASLMKPQGTDISQRAAAGADGSGKAAAGDAIKAPPAFYVRNLLFNKESVPKIRRRFIAFDTETTGFSPKNDRIVEIGAVLFENGAAKKRFQTLVNPGISIPPRATAVNHITNDMLAGAPAERQVYPYFQQFLMDGGYGDSLYENEIILAAHNANFDISFLRAAYERCGLPGKFCCIDTLQLAKRFLPELPDRKLDTVAEYFGIENKKAHRASSDAEVCGEILVRFLMNR